MQNQRVSDVMTANPACCTPDTGLQDVAKLMSNHDCGCIPVVEGNSNKVLGVITDRDITLRAVAEGKDVRQLKAGDIMSRDVVTAKMDDSVADCCRMMEDNQVRRVPVVDEQGACCGMVAQADVALNAQGKVGEVVAEVSKPTSSSNNVK